MALKTTVIINEVTNLSDARYCAGMGVDYIGFRIDESHDKYVDLTHYNEITNWISGISFIGESSFIADQKKIEHKTDQLLFDDIDLLTHYNGQPVFWSLPIEKLHKYSSVLSDNASNIEAIIITGIARVVSQAHKAQIKSLADKFDLFLSFGINSYNVLALIEELPLKGLSLKGSDEIRPGFKDYHELADILEELEEEE